MTIPQDGSQRLQILDQLEPLSLRQHSSDHAWLARTRRALERMPHHTVAVDRLAVAVGGREQALALVAGWRLAGEDAVAHLLRIVVARADAEFGRALGGGLQHPVQ